MAKWEYTLTWGKALRQAIEEEKPDRILEVLAECFKQINSILPKDYDDYDLQEDLDDIENQLDNLENYEEYGMSYQDVIEEIDYILNNLYDLCDSLRIWVDM